MDKRIKTALQMVTDCPAAAADNYTVFDIGADHASLSIELRRVLPRARIVATDIHEGPLSAARANVARVLGSDGNIEFILSDGFANIPFPADCAVITGMGGETIADIIAGYKFPPGFGHRPRLILGAHTKQDILRRVLGELGYVIVREERVVSKKHSYQLWEAVHGETCDNARHNNARHTNAKHI